MSFLSLFVKQAALFAFASVLILAGVLLIGFGVARLRALSRPVHPVFGSDAGDSSVDDGLEVPANFDNQQRWVHGLEDEKLPTVVSSHKPDNERRPAIALIVSGAVLFLAGAALFFIRMNF